MLSATTGFVLVGCLFRYFTRPDLYPLATLSGLNRTPLRLESTIMGYGVTLFFYLLVGSSIGIALWMSRPEVMSHPGELSLRGGHGFQIWFSVVTAPFFSPCGLM